MSTKIKICGIKDLATTQLCEQLGVDYLGFNLIESSPRFINGQTMIELTQTLNKSLAIAVMLFEDIGKNEEFLADESIHALQIYQADLEQLKSLQKFNKKIIYPISIKENLDIKLLTEIAPYVDYFIFDTYQQDKLGGTGEAFDWNLLKDFSAKPFFVSGGLNVENINDLLATINPYAVDVASGVETSGQKDPVKISNFVQKIRSYAK